MSYHLLCYFWSSKYNWTTIHKFPVAASYMKSIMLFVVKIIHFNGNILLVDTKIVKISLICAEYDANHRSYLVGQRRTLIKYLRLSGNGSHLNFIPISLSSIEMHKICGGNLWKILAPCNFSKNAALPQVFSCHISRASIF